MTLGFRNRHGVMLDRGCHFNVSQPDALASRMANVEHRRVGEGAEEAGGKQKGSSKTSLLSFTRNQDGPTGLSRHVSDA
jgi:hypothetical protein